MLQLALDMAFAVVGTAYWLLFYLGFMRLSIAIDRQSHHDRINNALALCCEKLPSICGRMSDQQLFLVGRLTSAGIIVGPILFWFLFVLQGAHAELWFFLYFVSAKLARATMNLFWL